MSLIEEPKVHRFTAEEYYAMADAGLFQDQRVELIEGEIIDMAPQKNAHAVAVGLVIRRLGRVFPETTHWIRSQQPLHLGKRSQPEPDIAVVAGGPRDYRAHPTSALLVVEASETTLAFDRTRKAQLYAQAGVPDYWIVNLIDQTLEVHRDRHQDAAGVWSYADVRTLTPNDTVSPLAATQASILVADLLP